MKPTKAVWILVACMLAYSSPVWACGNIDVSVEYKGVKLKEIEKRFKKGEMAWAMAAAMWRYKLESGQKYANARNIDPKDKARIRAVIIAALGAVYSGGAFSLDHRRSAKYTPEPEHAYAWAHRALRELTTLPGQPSKQVLDAFAQVYLHSPHEHERAQGLAMSLEAFDAGRITSHAWLARLATHPELAADSKVAVKKKCLEVLGGDHPWCSTGVVDTTKPTKNYRSLCNMVID